MSPDKRRRIDNNRMVNTLGRADVIWLIFLYSIFFAALPNVEGSEPRYIEKNKMNLYHCKPNMAALVEKPSSVVVNLKVDLERLEMTWDPNVTVNICYVDTPGNRDYGEKINTTCLFESVMLHEGATFVAETEYVNQPLLKTFPPEEKDGTSAENFSCTLYNVSSVNCTWDAGRNAPDDVQYFLYLKYSRNRRERKRECPHYISNAFGRHIACHIPNMPLKNLDRNYYFYVNGSSNTSQIRYYDVLLKPCNYEMIGPLQSITKNCSQLPKCRIQWTPPPNNENCGVTGYEIKDEINNTNESLYDDYKFIYVEEKHIIRIRMCKHYIDNDIKHCGEWSEQIILDLPPQSIPLRILILILVALGIILMVLIQFFLCKRYRIWHKLTPPVPQPKNIFQQYIKSIENEWVDPVPTVHESDEKITVVEEVNNGLRK